MQRILFLLFLVLFLFSNKAFANGIELDQANKQAKELFELFVEDREAVFKLLKKERTIPLYGKNKNKKMSDVIRNGEQTILGGRPKSYEIVRSYRFAGELARVAAILKYPAYPAVLDLTFYSISGKWKLISIYFSINVVEIDQFPYMSYGRLSK